MRWSASNPRVVLSVLFSAILFWSVISAYVERPRLQVGFGGIGNTIPINQGGFNNVKVRSVQFRDELEDRLTSPEFIRALRAKDTRQPPFFREGTPVVVRRITPPGLDVNPFAAALSRTVLGAYQTQTLVFMQGESGQADLYVMYLFPQSYRVYQPDNSWIRWFQARLPGMPDTTKLAAEADAANQAVKDSIDRQVGLAVKAAALSSRK
jgi:hypothetical protein